MRELENTTERLLGASVFSGAGIGDMGFRTSGIEHLAMCELEEERAALARLNFPKAIHFAADIWTATDSFCGAVEKALHAHGAEQLFLVVCTAPCQGMSKGGKGTLLNNIRQGKRPKLDPRNRLILPALEVIARLRPEWVVFENVVEMRGTVIEDGNGKLRRILDIIEARLGPAYVGEAYDVEFADYGIPQRRERLITVYTRNKVARDRYLDGIPLIPPRTHARFPTELVQRWVSVIEALQGFPELDSIDAAHAMCSDIPFHYVPVLDPKKYEWIRYASPGSSAFDNQCVNPACGYGGNTAHGTERENGINRAKKDTPLYCEKCGSLLPRPYTAAGGGRKRIMSGFTSAYKRMEPDLPAPALTRNLSYPCSDNKIHPYQNRVLSLAEAMELQTISRYAYKWGPIQLGNAKRQLPLAPDSLIRLVIGESVPPRFFEILSGHIKALCCPEQLPEKVVSQRQPGQRVLF